MTSFERALCMFTASHVFFDNPYNPLYLARCEKEIFEMDDKKQRTFQRTFLGIVFVLVFALILASKTNHDIDRRESNLTSLTLSEGDGFIFSDGVAEVAPSTKYYVLQIGDQVIEPERLNSGIFVYEDELPVDEKITVKTGQVSFTVMATENDVANYQVFYAWPFLIYIINALLAVALAMTIIVLLIGAGVIFGVIKNP